MTIIPPLIDVVVGLQIFVRECDDVSILDFQGRSTIDDGESELLSSHLKKFVNNGVRKLLLNLADLTRIDSSGISVIVETRASLGGRRRTQLLCPSGRVLELLTVFRLLEATSSFENKAQALATFGARLNSATS